MKDLESLPKASGSKLLVNPFVVRRETAQLRSGPITRSFGLKGCQWQRSWDPLAF